MIFVSLLFPAFSAGLLLILPTTRTEGIKKAFFLSNLLSLGFLLYCAYHFELWSSGELRAYTNQLDWIPGTFPLIFILNPLSWVFGVLTTLIYCVFSGVCLKTEIPGRKYFLFLLLLAETGILGVFYSGDGISFYIFWEAVLIPFYFILLIWGKKNNIKFISMKYIGYTMTGSLLFLVALIFMAKLHYDQFDSLSFVFSDWKNIEIPHGISFYLFWGFMFAFLIKTPIFPVHSWQPDTYNSLPTAATALFGSLFSKVGLYGILTLVIPFFSEPLKEYATFLSILSVITILYGALLAFSQKNLKGVIAYSSISHLGFMLLGIASLSFSGLQGTVFLMISHALITAGLFLSCLILEQNFGTLQIEQFGGISRTVPVYAAIFIYFAFASIGLPGLSGFIGEFLVLKGAFEFNPYFAGFATLGIIFSACYFLSPIQKIFYGPPSETLPQKGDLLLPSQTISLSVLIAAVLILGVFPMILLNSLELSIQSFYRILSP